MPRTRRRAAIAATVLLGLLLAGQSAPPQRAAASEVRLLEIEGVIGPLVARYVIRELGEAARGEAGLVVVRLDTPGGLDTSMREVTRAILASPVPVVVYVAPSGARAASAGMFITLAAPLAAMAPGTNIGAAHPVALGGGGQEPSAVAEKIAQDAAAYARALAQEHGRNAEWAERAVLESVSITAEEALDEGVIELLAPNLDALLAQLDGRTVRTSDGEQTLRTAGAVPTERPMNFAERVLQTLVDPNLAYVLFTLGLIGLAAELYSPGMLFPGIAGVLSIILALVAFGSLPVNWAGLLLIVVAIGLVIGELMTEGFGVLGVGGLIAFILGSLMLYQPIGPVSPAAPKVAVSTWVVAVMAALMAGFLLLVARAFWGLRKLRVATGIEALVGRTGVTDSELKPEGKVRLDGESWTAVTDEPPIPPGQTVRVVGAHGVTLKVARSRPEQGEPSHA